jgi:dihydroxy-acid dehydratase
MGCSTNAVIHVIAMARRAKAAVDLEDFDRLSRKYPQICSALPS